MRPGPSEQVYFTACLSNSLHEGLCNTEAFTGTRQTLGLSAPHAADGLEKKEASSPYKPAKGARFAQPALTAAVTSHSARPWDIPRGLPARGPPEEVVWLLTTKKKKKWRPSRQGGLAFLSEMAREQ